MFRRDAACTGRVNWEEGGAASRSEDCVIRMAVAALILGLSSPRLRLPK